MCVTGVEEPAKVCVGAILDGEADELDAEPAALVLGQHVDVGEVGDHVAVGDGAGETDLAPAKVEADDALRIPDVGFLACWPDALDCR